MLWWLCYMCQQSAQQFPSRREWTAWGKKHCLAATQVVHQVPKTSHQEFKGIDTNHKPVRRIKQMTIVDSDWYALVIYSIETSHQELTCINIQNPVVAVLLSTRTNGLCMESHWALQHWYSIAFKPIVTVALGIVDSCAVWVKTQILPCCSHLIWLLWMFILPFPWCYTRWPIQKHAYSRWSQLPIRAMFGNLSSKTSGHGKRKTRNEFLDSCRCRFFCGAIATTSRSLGVLGSFCDKHKVVDCWDIIDLRLCSSTPACTTSKPTATAFDAHFLGEKDAQCKLYKLNDSTWLNKSKYCSISKPAILESLS